MEQANYDKLHTDQWREELGKACPLCKGTGSYYDSGDAHKSAGIIPCPAKLWIGNVQCGPNHTLVKK